METTMLGASSRMQAAGCPWPCARPLGRRSSAPRRSVAVVHSANGFVPITRASEAISKQRQVPQRARSASSTAEDDPRHQTDGEQGAPDTGRGSKGDAWQREVLSAMSEAEGFAELTIRAKVSSAQPWHTITVRPVSLRGGRHMQVTTFTARQSTSVNHVVAAGDTAATEAVVGPLLAAAGLGSVALRTQRQDLAVQITKRGKGIVHRGSPQARPALVSVDPGRTLSHDRPKDTPIPADQPHPFLQKIGFQTADGRIRANMQDKFSQVNEFLKLLGHTGLIRDLTASRQAISASSSGPSGSSPATGGPSHPAASSGSAGAASSSGHASPSSGGGSSPQPLHILDCGCGSSHLSFGTYHYLNHVLGLPATLGGVDVNAALMARANDNAAAMGLQGVRFDTAPIGEYSPPARPDIVLALHACDTATDDALALAVKQASPLIMAVPCCHAHLHKQLSGRPPSCRPPWAPLLRHGILRQRQLDLLTDTLRAQLLRVAGYTTDVVEFISTEHTPRNLLIRAVRQPQPQPPPPKPQRPPTTTAQRQQQPDGHHQGGSGTSSSTGDGGEQRQQHQQPGWTGQQLAAAREYVALRDYWQVTPRLEVLLESELGPLLAAAALQGGPKGAEDGEVEDDSDNGDADGGGLGSP